MIKMLATILAGIVMVMVIAPSVVNAQLTLGPECNATLPPSREEAAKRVRELKAAGQWKSGDLENPCNVAAFLTWIRKIIRFLLTIAIPIGILFIVYGAFVIITAGGSEERVKQGKGIITAAVVGVAVAFAAWLIVMTLERILKGGI